MENIINILDILFGGYALLIYWVIFLILCMLKIIIFKLIEPINKKLEIKALESAKFDTKVKSEEIFNYYAKIIIHKTKKEYTLQAEIKVVVARTYTGDMTPNVTKEIETVSYELQRLYWPSKGYISFVPKGADDTYKSPSLTIGAETIVSDIEGNKYTIILTDNIVEESIPQLEKVKKEQDNINNFRKKVFSDVNKLLKQTENENRYMAEFISDYRKELNKKVIAELQIKQRPAKKTAKDAEEIMRKYRKFEKDYLELKYRLSMYKELLPEIEELNKLPDKELLKLINQKNK